MPIAATAAPSAPARGEGRPAGVERRAPKVLRLVLDPAGGREMLRELLLPDARDRGVGPEQDGRVEVVPWSMARRRGDMIGGERIGEGPAPDGERPDDRRP
jgi:hypothetical protein